MKSRLTKLFSVLFLLLTIILLTGCEFPFNFGTTGGNNSNNNQSQVIEPKELKYRFYTIEDGIEDLSFIEGYPWINTSIEGVMGKIKRPEAKDDFFAYVNYDYLKDYKLPEGKDKFGGPIFDGEALATERLHKILDDSKSSLHIFKESPATG